MQALTGLCILRNKLYDKTLKSQNYYSNILPCMVWPTLGPRTAKEQNRTRVRRARNVYEMELHIDATWRIPLSDPRSAGGDAAVYKMFIHHVGRKI